MHAIIPNILESVQQLRFVLLSTSSILLCMVFSFVDFFYGILLIDEQSAWVVDWKDSPYSMKRIKQTKNRESAINLNWMKYTIVQWEQKYKVNYDKGIGKCNSLEHSSTLKPEIFYTTKFDIAFEWVLKYIFGKNEIKFSHFYVQSLFAQHISNLYFEYNGIVWKARYLQLCEPQNQKAETHRDICFRSIINRVPIQQQFNFCRTFQLKCEVTEFRFKFN